MHGRLFSMDCEFLILVAHNEGEERKKPLFSSAQIDNIRNERGKKYHGNKIMAADEIASN